MVRRMAQTLIIGLAITYVLFGAYLYFMQGKLIYFPSEQDFFQCEGFGGYEKMDYKGTRFYYLKQGDEAVVFYHGNAGSACDRSFHKPMLEPTGKSLVFVEYSGYSNHGSFPRKKAIVKDVKNVVEWVNGQNFKNVAVMGESIGSGAASYHSSIGEADGIILLSPFPSIAEAAPWLYRIYPLGLIMTENYDNVKYLEDYSSRILIIHGAKDDIIRPALSQELFDRLNTEKKERFLVSNAGHNDLFEFDETRKKIVEFLS